MFKNFKLDTDKHLSGLKEPKSKTFEVWDKNKPLNEMTTQDMKVEFSEQEEILKKIQTEIKLEMKGKKINKSNKKLCGKLCQQNGHTQDSFGDLKTKQRKKLLEIPFFKNHANGMCRIFEAPCKDQI